MPNELTRRKFLATSTIAAGFAIAAQPVFSQVITTDATGLTAGAVKIPVKDGELPAYRAMPAQGKNFPTILVVQEIFGVHAHIQDVCRRLAKAGYLAIAPELFYRQGDVSKLTDIQEVIGKVVSKVPDPQVLSDLDTTVAWAAKNSGDTSKLAITGFCWGGRITWLYAAHNPKVKAGIAWYGRLAGQASELTPKHPLDIAAGLQVPVLGLYGGKDTGIPLDTVEQMRAGLKTGKSGSEIVVYPEAPHAFYADYRASYRKPEAQDGWKRLLAWLKQHGV